VTHLAHRSGVYYLRLHIPKPVQAALLGQKEIFQSLQTSNHAEAKVLALCTLDSIDLEIRCLVDGELITYYSGDTGGFASAAVEPDALNPNKN